MMYDEDWFPWEPAMGQPVPDGAPCKVYTNDGNYSDRFYDAKLFDWEGYRFQGEVVAYGIPATTVPYIVTADIVSALLEMHGE